MRAALALRPNRTDLMAGGAAVLAAAVAGAVIAAPGTLGADRALAALLAAGAGIATVADLRAGLFLVVVSLSLPLLVTFGGTDIHPAHVLVGLFALRAAAEAWVGRARLPPGVLVPLLLILFGALLASVAGPRPGGSLFRLVDVFALPLIAITAIAAVFRPREHLRTLVLACAAALMIASLCALLQSAGYTIGPLEAPVEDRANGLFEHPNVLGGFVAPLLAVLTGVAAVAWREVPFPALTLAPPLLLGLPAVVLTLSRGALLGLAAAVAAMLLLLIAQRQVAAMLGVALALLIGITIAVPQLPTSQRVEFEQRIDQLFRPGTELGRDLIYKQAFRTLGEYPLTGVGPLTFGKLTRESTTIPDIEPGREHAHNLFLEGALSLGPVGLLALLWMIGGAVQRYRHRIRAPDSALELGWAVGAVAALVAMAAQGIGDFIFSNLEPLTLLAVFVGTGYAFGRREPRAAAA